MKTIKVKIHKYLEMNIDFSKKGKVRVNMSEYAKKMIDKPKFYLGNNVSKNKQKTIY